LANKLVFQAQASNDPSGTMSESDGPSDQERLLDYEPRPLRRLPDVLSVNGGWNYRQLLFVFNKFGMLARPAYMVELFERAVIMADKEGDLEARRFVSIPQARMFYGQALRRMGFVADAIKVLLELRESEAVESQGETSNYLGDAYVMKSQAAWDLAEALELRNDLDATHAASTQIPGVILMWVVAFCATGVKKEGWQRNVP